MAIQDKRGKRFIEDYRRYDLEERELYRKLPHLHKWWNKLYLAETMGYQCGPGATEIPETKEYVIRPIYNLGGMGICTTIKVLEKGDISKSSNFRVKSLKSFAYLIAVVTNLL